MNYIVLDLEWNQVSPGKEPGNKDLPFEIIEIGAVKLDSSMNKISEFCQVIRPKVYPHVHYKIKEITNLDSKTLALGKPFPDVFSRFLKWCGEDFMICTWGPMDVTELQRNMKYYGMEPISDRPVAFYDVQKLFSIAYEDRKSRRSLEYAIDFLNIKKDSPFHRAISDAYYTAKILSSIDNKSVFSNISYDTFVLPKSKDKEIFAVFDNYAKYISREFEDKTEIMADRQIMSSKCYICHKNLKKKVRWFTPNGKHYYCVANCDKHGLMKFKIRIKKSENNKVYVVKTMKYISKEEADIIKIKKERSKEMKKIKKQQKAQNKDSDE